MNPKSQLILFLLKISKFCSADYHVHDETVTRVRPLVVEKALSPDIETDVTSSMPMSDFSDRYDTL